MKKLSPAVKGIITGIVMVITTLIFVYTKLPYESPVQYLVFLFYAVGMTWTLWEHARSAGFVPKFGVIFGKVFQYFIAVTLIMTIFAGVFASIHPEYAEEEAVAYRQQLVKEGNRTTQQIDETVATVKKGYVTRQIRTSIFGYLILGALFTAVGTGILIMRRQIN